MKEKVLNVCTTIDRDNLEPIFDAARGRGLTLSNFTFIDAYDDSIISFDMHFPATFTKDDFDAMLLEYRPWLDELDTDGVFDEN